MTLKWFYCSYLFRYNYYCRSEGDVIGSVWLALFILFFLLCVVNVPLCLQCCFMLMFILKSVIWFTKFLSILLHGLLDVVRDDPTNNVPDNIFSKLGMQLHRRDHHPLGILKNAIYEYFDTNYSNKFNKFDDLSPIVSVKEVLQNTWKN